MPKSIKRNSNPAAMENLAAIADSLNLGRVAQVRIFDNDDVIQLLRVVVEQNGGQVGFAKRNSIDRSHVNRALRRKKPVGDAVARALKLRKIYVLELP